MNDNAEKRPLNPESRLGKEVGEKATRKLKAQRQVTPGIWFGLGMMGLIGWSIAVPTLLGAGLGMWIDRRFPSDHSWTLALLVAGLLIGCWNAWHWLSREGRDIQEEQGDE